MSEALRALTLGTLVIEVPGVETLNNCKTWYEAVGLPKMDLDQPGESYWFDLGNEILLGIHTGAVAPPSGFTIYLNVADVDELYESLTARGFEFDSEPETKFWGRSAQLRDPAGTFVRLVTSS